MRIGMITMVLLAVIFFCGTVAVYASDETVYVGTVTGYWNDASCWNQGDAPMENTDARVNVNPEITITLTNSAVINRIELNGGGSATALVVDGGSLKTVEPTWNAVGYDNSAAMLIKNGGSLEMYSRLDIGLYDNVDGQVNTFTMEPDSGDVKIRGTFRMGESFDGVNGTLPVHATSQAFIRGGTLFASGLSLRSAGTTRMDFSGKGAAVIKGDIRSTVADYVATSKMTASEANKLVRAEYDSRARETTIRAVPDRADYVEFQDAGTKIAGGGDGDWANGANWKNETISYSDGYAAGANDTVKIDGGVTATLTGSAVIGGLLLGDSFNVGSRLVVDGGTLRVVDASLKGWSALGYKESTSIEIKNGGSIDFEDDEHVMFGAVDDQDDALIEMTITDGSLTTAGEFRMAWNFDGSNIASVHLTIGDGGLLVVGKDLRINTGSAPTGKGSVWINILGGGTLIVNKDITDEVAAFAADGRMLFNGKTGGVAGTDYIATVVDGITTVVAISESPPPLGLVTIIGVGILLLRRKTTV